MQIFPQILHTCTLEVGADVVDHVFVVVFCEPFPSSTASEHVASHRHGIVFDA